MKEERQHSSDRAGSPTAADPDEAASRFAECAADGYALLFQEYAPKVMGFMRAKGLSEGAAEEVTQDVMLSVWKKSESYDGSRGSVRTWVFAIARNRHIDYLRRSRRPEPDPDDPCWVESMTTPVEPESHAVAQQRRQQLADALKALQPEQREALRSQFYRGNTSSEAASELGVPVGTVKSRTRRALAALRQRLSGESPGDEDA